MSAPTPPTREKAVSARVDMLSGKKALPALTHVALTEIRAASAAYAEQIASILERVPNDTGRMIAALDHIQLAKNIACDAVILPHYKPS